MRLHDCARLSLVAGLVMAVHVAPSRAQQASDQLKSQIERRLSGERDLRTITVSVQGSEVTLSGEVPSLWAKEQAIEKARETRGVQMVMSDLTIASAESDLELAQDVVRAIENYVYYTVFDYVDGTVNNGVVTLFGAVTPQRERSKEIREAVARVRGVRELRNQIETLPASSTDDELRYILARRIFSNYLFERFSTQAVPPFHIIVHNSVVTLVGVVQSDIERLEMQRIAAQTQGVLRVENNLQTRLGR